MRKAATGCYQKWIEEECGFIQLDGLPTDGDLGATRLKLENLFVPLKRILSKRQKDTEKQGKEREKEEKVEVLSVGKALATHSHLAVLASPGGGKSTLLKRLAVAYMFPERKDEIADDLPKVKKIPLYLRCRELRERAHRPTLELLGDLPVHAGMNEGESKVFREAMHEALRDGKALILIDGLDEISDDGTRKAFAQNLRTFIAMFPTASLVVTSREAGFRLVAGVVASVCEQTLLAPLAEDDVKRLCERWNVAVFGDKPRVLAEAQDLAGKIWGNDRIRALAENPLLLTTLLVVKRWFRELPRSRAALYRVAVNVLIRTWNVEGFDPLDEEETLAQLSYVACSMMEAGQQQIGRKALLKLLQEARKELDAELGYAKISPSDFIERIEYRSSLLMQVGHAEVEGEIQELFEFRHLTFQEYLAARGFVQEQYPGRNDGKNLADLLEPHFEDERWREVIPLATVMAGRKAEETIKRLTKACEVLKFSVTGGRSTESHVLLLCQCLLDEVQVGDSALRAALLQMGRHVRAEMGSLIDLRRGKFGEILRQVVEGTYLSGEGCWDEMFEAVAVVSIHSGCGKQDRSVTDELPNALATDLLNGDRVERVRAALVCMIAAYNRSFAKTKTPKPMHLQTLRDALCEMVQLPDPPLALAGCWALAWFGEQRVVKEPPSREVLLSLYHLWREAESKELAYFAAWALSTQPLMARDEFQKREWGKCEKFLRLAEGGKDRIGEDVSQPASFVVGWYRRGPWSDEELAKKIGSIPHCIGDNPTSHDILETLGEPGRKVLEESEKAGRMPSHVVKESHGFEHACCHPTDNSVLRYYDDIVRPRRLPFMSNQFVNEKLRKYLMKVQDTLLYLPEPQIASLEVPRYLFHEGKKLPNHGI